VAGKSTCRRDADRGTDATAIASLENVHDRGRWPTEGQTMNVGHPLTMLVAAYVLPAAVTAYTVWVMYLGSAEPARRRRR
jgi:hypothetical protein